MTDELPTPPWDVVSHDGIFEVRATSGEHIYIHFEEEPFRRAALKRLSREQAKTIALALARLLDKDLLNSAR
jgi:hypothetical protein